MAGWVCSGSASAVAFSAHFLIDLQMKGATVDIPESGVALFQLNLGPRGSRGDGSLIWAPSCVW
jgi:hypothetical protein